jgi:hypothetical protein
LPARGSLQQKASRDDKLFFVEKMIESQIVLIGHCAWPVSDRKSLLSKEIQPAGRNVSEAPRWKIRLKILSLKMDERPPVSPARPEFFRATLGVNIMHEFGLVNDFLARKWLTLRPGLAIFQCHCTINPQLRSAPCTCDFFTLKSSPRNCRSCGNFMRRR